jgi:hypothetical protein
MAEVRGVGGRLMYTPHPPGNRIGYVSPARLAEASRRIYRITYASLVDVYETIREITRLVAELEPALVVFFATGGIPIVFPIMRHLSASGRRDLTDGSVFHMLPGLAWDGQIEGQGPQEYFDGEVAPLLARIRERGERCRIVAVDTTNSGNAVNLAVGALMNACARAGLADVDVRVIGVVNVSGAADEAAPNRTALRLADGNEIFVLTPAGYEPTRQLQERQFIEFRPRAAGDAMPAHGGPSSLMIGYWGIDELFTEDNADLLGIAAVQDRLGVDTTGAPGRMEITFENGRVKAETGLAAVGNRLLSLLSNERDSIPWMLLARADALAPESEEERAFRETTALDRDAGLSLIEMNQNPAATLDHLLKVPALLRPIEIYWLATLAEPPVEATARVVAALRRARAGGSDADDQTIVEAARFLRRAYPEAAAGELRSEDWAAVQVWWLETYGRLRGGQR